MRQLADVLSKQAVAQLDRPVVDQTGLASEYDFTVRAVADPLSSVPSDAPPNFLLFSALELQLGLKLKELDRGEVEVLAIRKIEPPSEN